MTQESGMVITRRLTPFRQWSGRLVHRHGADQPAVLGQGPGAQCWNAVTFEPGAKHWRGTAPTTAMTRIAIQAPDEWMEHVSEQQYGE